MVLWCVQINCIIGSCALIPLQSAIKASTGKGKKDKKKNKKATVDDQAEDLDGEAAPAPSKAPVEVTAEDLADEEWGPVKGKKGKKGKGEKAHPSHLLLSLCLQDGDEDEDKEGFFLLHQEGKERKEREGYSLLRDEYHPYVKE